MNDKNIVEYTRFLRQQLINLDNKKKKLIEDKNKHAVKLLETEYNHLLGTYIEYSKRSIEIKKK
tara:strand:- start:997 stop:1188 length:192 start_codon:yes stop_codon:yes gene_type:complete